MGFHGIPDLGNIEPSYDPIPHQPCLLTTSMCAYFQYDAWSTYLALWVGLMTLWVILLCVSQLLLIAQNITTNENMRGSHYEYLHAYVDEDDAARIESGWSRVPGDEDDDGSGANRKLSRWTLARLLGFSKRRRARSHAIPLVATSSQRGPAAQADGSVVARPVFVRKKRVFRNPFDGGAWWNLTSFFLHQRQGIQATPFGSVDWTAFYELPGRYQSE
jgi:hypothetical protein